MKINCTVCDSVKWKVGDKLRWFLLWHFNDWNVRNCLTAIQSRPFPFCKWIAHQLFISQSDLFMFIQKTRRFHTFTCIQYAFIFRFALSEMQLKQGKSTQRGVVYLGWRNRRFFTVLWKISDVMSCEIVKNNHPDRNLGHKSRQISESFIGCCALFRTCNIVTLYQYKM